MFINSFGSVMPRFLKTGSSRLKESQLKSKGDNFLRQDKSKDQPSSFSEW